MSILLYEKSASCQGHLIIPFVYSVIQDQHIYSYKLLSARGYKDQFHKSENPAAIYSGSVEGMIEIAKEHLNKYSDLKEQMDNFQSRYTYKNNLIIIYECAGKYFYDHYKSEDLINVAAPKIFQSEYDCIKWVKEGLDNSNATQKAKFS
ncbi:hypothetical protein Cri9333_1330 [Crinalium epipsammum PCC 9333]|uniref:Uncharacterized protein n=1 Tax=Crinalium epipsammum PCC 9333 TaxID=1173022 RepID=K9VXJ7_9CYAN|nr:hypothetical protein [Crinalium epipsammum]AFZ12227.1 hypothetical protein Cri9333_1330 [Crinalium epipsammum PCC 9333]